MRFYLVIGLAVGFIPSTNWWITISVHQSSPVRNKSACFWYDPFRSQPDTLLHLSPLHRSWLDHYNNPRPCKLWPENTNHQVACLFSPNSVNRWHWWIAWIFQFPPPPPLPPPFFGQHPNNRRQRWPVINPITHARLYSRIPNAGNKSPPLHQTLRLFIWGV